MLLKNKIWLWNLLLLPKRLIWYECMQYSWIVSIGVIRKITRRIQYTNTISVISNWSTTSLQFLSFLSFLVPSSNFTVSCFFLWYGQNNLEYLIENMIHQENFSNFSPNVGPENLNLSFMYNFVSLCIKDTNI